MDIGRIRVSLLTLTTGFLLVAAVSPLAAAGEPPAKTLEIVFEVQSEAADPVRVLDEAAHMLARRAEAYGLKDASIVNKDGLLRITATDRPGAEDVLTRRGHVSIHVVDDSDAAYDRLKPLPDQVKLNEWQGLKWTYRELVTAKERTLRHKFIPLLLPERTLGLSLEFSEQDGGMQFSAVIIHPTPVLTSANMVDAKVAEGSGSGMRAIHVRLNEAGTKSLGEATTANLNGRLAVIVDDEVLHRPKIRAAITGGAIHVTKCAWRVKLNAPDLARAYAATLRAPLPKYLSVKRVARTP